MPGANGVDRGELLGHVERGEMDHVLEVLADLRGQEDRVEVIRSSVDDAMADGLRSGDTSPGMVGE